MNKERFIKNFTDFVKIPSESSNEEEFLKYFEGFVKNLGGTSERDSYGNLIARFPAKNSNKTEYIAFGAHADTVKPGVGIKPIVKDDKITSDGTTVLGSDDKAGLAEAIEAMMIAEKHPPIEIIVTKEEEIGSFGSSNLDYSLVKSKEAYVIDGEYVNEIIVGGPTLITLDIEITGKSAHAGMAPQEGISSIQVAANAISRLKLGLYDENSTANIGIIKGGEIRNGIPEKTTVTGECRSLDHEKALKICEEMKKAFTEEAEKLGAKVEIKDNVALKAYNLPETEKVIATVKEGMKKAGLEAKMTIIKGGTDATHFNANGVKTAVLGVGNRKIHSVDEYLLLDSAEKIINAMKHTMEALA
jgi:tripeptide aminopeptidase